MHILIHIGNTLISEAIRQLLTKNGYDDVMVHGQDSNNGFVPEVVLTDISTISEKLIAGYPNAKILLMDTGVEKERIITTLLSYKIHGILSTDTEFPLLKKALQVVSQGQVWIDNSTVKTFLHDSGIVSKAGKINGITSREKEIIEYVCQGYTNKEIANKLALSEHTVKAHLNRIFKKFNATSRSKLITLVMNSK
ncbi:MAG TPA: response regulator transcription factor [Syntrophorhabdales bacterium]|nr:response regulator transcription factor [Syntrophorhabdales bacterium]